MPVDRDRTAQGRHTVFKLRDWFVLGPAAVCALILGVIGFMTCGSETHCHVDGFGQALIRSFTLLKGGDFYPPRDPWTLVIAQYLVPGIAIWAAGKLFFAN